MGIALSIADGLIPDEMMNIRRGGQDDDETTTVSKRL